MLKRKYDLSFRLGKACSCTHTLRAANLQLLSFPFDRIAIRNRPADIRFRVADYRTPDEIRAGKEKAHEKKKSQIDRYARYGSNSFWQYEIVRAGNAIKRILAVPMLAIVRCRAKRFDQIVPLGRNCEVAFRFYCRWKFVDSSLFAWAQVLDLGHLTGTLGHIDTLFEGEMTLDRPTMMWKCENDGMYVHGNLKVPPRGAPTPTEAAIAADKASTQARIRHLKESSGTTRPMGKAHCSSTA